MTEMTDGPHGIFNDGQDCFDSVDEPPRDPLFADLSDVEQEILRHDLGVAESEAQNRAAASSPDDRLSWLEVWLPEKLATLRAEEAWLERERNRLDNYRRGLLYRWGAAVRHLVERRLAHQRGKSIDTPGGRVGFRRVPEQTRIAIVDEAAAIAHAETHCPEAVRVTKRLLVSVLKALPTPIPGTQIQIIPAEDRFYIGEDKLPTHEPPLLDAPTDRPNVRAFFGKE